MRKLLGHLCGWYFPTLDSKKVIKSLESLCREFGSIGIQYGPEEALKAFNFKKSGIALNDVARFWGHTCAVFDYLRFEVFPKVERGDYPLLKKRNPDWLARARLANGEFNPELVPGRDFFRAETIMKVLDLDFTSRGEFSREYGYAFCKTFTSDGQRRLVGKTDASEIYLRLFFYSAMWLEAGRPKSIAELNRQMHPIPSGETLTPLEMLQKQDEQKQMEIRLQQICFRLGLHLRPSKRKFLKKRRLKK